MEPNLKKFLFDVIITRIAVDMDCPKNDDEDDENDGIVQCGEWEVSIKDLSFKLESNRVLVVNFPKTPLYEFHTQPCDLCDTLGKEGLRVTAYRDGKRFGEGCSPFPNYILSQLFEDTCMLTHIMECEILRRRKVIGIVELSFRIKSGMPDEDAVNTFECGVYDVCRPIDKSINPLDLMLVMGRPQRSPNVKCIAEKSMVTGTPPQPFVCVSPLRGEQKCQMGQAGMNNFEAPQSVHDRKGGGEPMTGGNFCKCTQMVTSTSSTELNTDELQEDPLWNCANDFSQPTARNLFAPCPTLSPPDLLQVDFKTPRRCLICKEDLTWLPKIATCPYCDYKPVPELEVRPYDENTTAAQLLHRFITQPKTDSTEPSEMEGKSRDGVCKNNTDCTINMPCARCRIRKLCQEMLNIEKQTLKMLQEDKLAKPKSTTPKKLPTLMEVFTDMKAKYDKKAQEKCPKMDTAQKICSDICKQKLKRRGAKCKKKGKKKNPCLTMKRRRREHKIKSKIYASVPTRSLMSEAHMRHKKCAENGALGEYTRVPCDVGWLWQIDPKAVKYKNWKPGAITRPIRQIMAYFLRDYPADSVPISRYSCRVSARRRAYKALQCAKNADCFTATEEASLVQKPTLHICKKDGEYIITLRPLKNANLLTKCADPYMQMKPVIFRIVKDPKLVEKRKLKRALRELGFSKCICHRPIVNCFCRSFVDKKRLLQEVNEQCRELKLKHTQDDFVLSESSDSEQEYDFGVTPPAGLIKPCIKKKPDMVNTETQYDWKDWHLQNKFNPVLNYPFYWYSMCGTGEKKPIKPKKKKPKKAASKKKGRK